MKAALLVLPLLGQPAMPISDRVPVFNVEAMCRDVSADDKASDSPWRRTPANARVTRRLHSNS